jgi:hypothetical protein|tara:strand:- start:17439 stop:17738 length:300 start_codon:yes stop_codon:yes gene_type:complete
MYFRAAGGYERNILLAGQLNEKVLFNDPDHEQARTMQMLAERLRRARNPPLTQDVQSFTFKPLPTDIGNTIQPGQKDPVKYAVNCEAYSACVPVDRGKK